MRSFLVVVGGLICSFLFMYCDSASIQSIEVGAEPFEYLSDYGFFEGDLKELQPSAGVLPYDLSSSLFSDYSHKARFVWMPEGTSVNYNTEHVMDWPAGAVLIKNFFYYHNETDLSQGRRLIETRLLVNRGEQWDAYGYTWNDEQTDAAYDVIGDIKAVSWINEVGEEMKVDYIIPNKNQCKGCHAYDNKLKPIGPKARNINKDYAYADGSKNQLAKWAETGYLTGYTVEAKHPSVAVWNDDKSYTLHERSMAYLDINCGHCHNPKGAGNTSGLTLLADSELGLKVGVFKATVSAGAGTGGHQYSIVPGNPDESIMVYRMNSNDPGAMMPELGRHMVHTEGVDLIASWIKAMENTSI